MTRIDLCGVRVDVETDHPDFAQYLEAQFPGDAADDALRPPDLSVRVRWSEGPEPKLTPHAVFPGWQAETRIDRHVWMAPGRLLCLRVDDAPQIAIASDATCAPRRLELRFHFTLGRRGWREIVTRALAWRRLAALRHHRLSTLAYYAVYYPAWWHLEAQGKAHPLHAAGVALGGRGLLLGGLPGCGKSTLATSLLGTPDAELLSDNIVLHDATRIYGCFEPLLLDADTRAWLSATVHLTPLGRTHQYRRDAFHLPHRADGVPIGAAVVLARGRETRLLRIPSGDCARMLLAINESAKEVRRYHILSAQLALVERNALGYQEQRLAHLDRLLANVPCYWMEVREGAPAEAVAALRELLAPAREAAG